MFRNLILLVSFSIEVFSDCNFNTFNESVLSTNKPFVNSQIYIDPKKDFGFGLWTKYVPLQNFDYENQPVVGSPTDSSNTENGKLLMSIKTVSKDKFFLVLFFESFRKTQAYHQAYFLYNSKQYYFDMGYDSLYYEGFWIYSYVAYSRYYKYIEYISFGPMIKGLKGYWYYYSPSDIVGDQLILTIGGSGKVQIFVYIDRKYLNLGQYNGHFSKLVQSNIFFMNFNDCQSYFYTTNCFVVDQCQDIMKNTIIDEPLLFDGYTNYFAEKQYIGVNYIIQFWMKVDFTKLVQSSRMLILRATQNKNYNNYENFGDVAFLIRFFADIPENRSTYDAAVYNYQTPNINDLTQGNIQLMNSFKNWDKITEASQTWHYMQYTQETNIYLQNLVIWFPSYDFQTSISLLINKSTFRQFSNSMMYFHVGVDNFYTAQKFYGSIAKLQFYNCLPETYFNDLGLDCHPTCYSDCIGPTQNECLNCNTNQNRYWLAFKHICECKIGFIDNRDDFICRDFYHEFPIIQQIQIQKNVVKSDKISCPFTFENENKQSIMCLECLSDPTRWIKNPVCLSDYFQLNNDYLQYTYQERTIQSKEIYFVNQVGLIQYCHGCLEYCSSAQSNCNLSNYYSQTGSQIYVKCKSQYYFKNGFCTECTENCFECDQQGKCISCLPNFYLKSDVNLCINCPQHCNQCYYDNSQLQVLCSSCFESQSLFNGKCYPCGQHCKICQYETIIESNENTYSFNRCLKCVDDSKYFQSFDAINCLENNIQFCLYAFQSHKDNRQLTTLNYQYKPLPLDDNIITICALCEKKYEYVMTFGETGYCQPNTEDYCENYAILNDKRIQLIGEPLYYCEYPIERNTYCFQDGQPLPNCLKCISPNGHSDFKCSLCISGYYPDRFNGICLVCPIENCLNCIQQMKSNQDGYKWKYKPFYEIYSRAVDYEFQEVAQSKNRDDYEVICSYCQQGYEVINGKCVPNCYQSNCQECVVENGQIKCLKCPNSQQGQMLSIYNGRCIECPYNCILCKPRTIEQIYEINPFFSNQQFLSSSHYCILPKQSEKNYFYDEEINLFIQCEGSSQCEHQWRIDRNVICSNDEYEQELASLSQTEKEIYQQNNIKLSELFSDQFSSHIQQIENEYIYKQGNMEIIKTINLRYFFNEQTKCQIDQNAFYHQLFSQNIFSAINVTLELIGDSKTQIVLSENLSFYNFSQITISNIRFYLNFTSQEQSKFKTLLFTNIVPYKILIQDCSFLSNGQSNYNIVINNTNSVIISNVHFQIIYQNIQQSFFSIYQFSETGSPTKLTNLIINQSKLTNTAPLINYNSSNPLLIENCQISAEFVNAQFLSISQIELTIIDFKVLQSKIQNTNYFMDLSKTRDFLIVDSKFSEIYLENSVLFNLHLNSGLSNIAFLNMEFQSQASLIRTVNNEASPLQLSFQKILMQNNSYSTRSFILLVEDQQQQAQSIVHFKDFNLLNNTRKIESQFPDQSQYQPLMFLNVSNVIFKNIVIERGIGAIEFSICNSDLLSITNLTTTLLAQFQFQALHQSLECIQQNANINYLWEVFYLLSIKSMKFQYIYLNNLIVVNRPIIYYQSQINEIQTNSFQINFDNWVIEHILLLTISQSTHTSIFSLISSLVIDININQVMLKGIHLNEYYQDSNSGSVATFYIECFACPVQIKQSQLLNNLVTNSSSPIMDISVSILEIIDTIVETNNILDFNLINQFLYQGFQNSTITLSQSKSLFPVTSISNFKLSVEQLFVNGSVFKNLYGREGSVFQISTKNKGILKIVNSDFSDISDGGVIFIDSQYSELSLKLQDLNLKFIGNIESGGMLYVKQSQNAISISIQDLNISNCQALQGSIIYLAQPKTSTSSVSLRNIQISTSQEGFSSFLSLYSEFKDKIKTSLVEFQHQIYVVNCQLIIDGYTIKSNYFQKFLYAYDSSLRLSNIIIANSSAMINLMEVIDDQSSSSIYFQNFQLSNITRKFPDLPEQVCNTESSIIPEMLCEQQSFELIFVNDDKEQINLGLCRLKELMKSATASKSQIQISLSSNTKVIAISNGQIQSFNNSGNNQSILNISYVTSPVQTFIKNISLSDNFCGLFGCIQVQSLATARRILSQSLETIKAQILIKISNLLCSSNLASYGTCLSIQQLSILVENSLFYNNTATQLGGAIFVNGSDGKVLATNNQFINNSDPKDQSIYISSEQLSLEILQLNTFSKANNINSSLIPVLQTPSQLLCRFLLNQPTLDTQRLFQNSSFTLDQVNYTKIFINYLTLPSGTQVSEYQIFHQENQSYSSPSISLQLILVDQFKQVIELENSECQLKSRIIELQDSNNLDIDFADQNLISLKSVTYNMSSQSFNLLNLIIQSSTSQFSDEVIQIQVYCQDIKTPLYSEDNRYQPTSYQNNYYYRINIKTLPCQLGEYLDENLNYCRQCDSSKRFFSIQPNATSCELQNGEIINNITSNNIELKKGFWRESYSNIQIDKCINYLENCPGGWKFGNDNCYQGHIGALCEECDIYNVRGEGQFSTSSKYACGNCVSIDRNIGIIIGVTIWTLISVALTVKASYDFVQQLRGNRKIMKIALMIALEECQGGILIKFLSNYFQIIGALSSFQLELPQSIAQFVLTTGNPIQTMIYSLDCILADSVNIDILYSRIIWEMSMPILYILLFVIGYMLLTLKIIILQKGGLLLVGIIYIYIFQSPNLIGSLISIISFRYADGIRWVQGHMAFRYDNELHYSLLPYFIILLLIIALFIPLFLFNRLSKIKDSLQLLKNRNMFGYIYNEYIDKAYYWEIVKLTIKDIIIITLTYYQDLIEMKAILVFLILQVQLYLTRRIQPYRLHYLNKLDEKMLIICQISMIIGFGLNQLKQYADERPQMSFLLLLIVFNLLYIIELIKKLLEAYLSKFQPQIDKVKEIMKKLFPQLTDRVPYCQKLLVNRTEQIKKVKQNFQKLFISLQISGMITSSKQKISKNQD